MKKILLFLATTIFAVRTPLEAIIHSPGLEYTRLDSLQYDAGTCLAGIGSVGVGLGLLLMGYVIFEDLTGEKAKSDLPRGATSILVNFAILMAMALPGAMLNGGLEMRANALARPLARMAANSGLKAAVSPYLIGEMSI